MKNMLQSNLIRSTGITTAAVETLLGLMLAVGAALSVHAQGQIASGTISGSGSGPYTYSLSFADGASSTSPIGSVWYAWTPGFFYLPGVPTSAVAPAGWAATVSANSVQFVAGSSGSYIQPGQSLSGFSYQAAFTPAELAAAPNSGLSVSYSGGLFVGGVDFTVQAAVVPEPSTLTLLIGGAGGLYLIGRRRLQAGSRGARR